LWFNVYAAYSYALLALTTFFFAQIVFRRRGVFRLQAILMLAGMFAPWIANAIYLLRLSPLPAYDWTPLAFLLTLVALEIGFTRYRLVDILPVAQSTIVNSMLDAILVVDRHGQIVDANPACERVFGLAEAELIGSDVRVHFPEWNAWTEATKPRSETSREFRLPGDPEQRIFNLRVETTTNPRGIVTGYLVILNDATRTVNAQRQMRLLVTALEAAQNGVVITDREGMVQWVNPAFTQLTGYERNEIIGHKPSLLKSGSQEGEFYKEMWQTILDGGVWRGELVNRRKDGSEYNEEMTITPLIRGDGAITNFIAIKQDVTERKLAEEQLRQAHQQALEANRLKTQLLANVSHDLRTPLGTIMGYAEMMLVEAFGAQNEQQKTATAEILNSANALLTFVNNLIGQAQIETGKIVLNNQPFEPAILVESVRSVVNYHAHKKGLSLDVDIDPLLPETLSGDSYWLRQILLNLANNAIKFTESGSVKIRTFRQDETTWGIEVKDTGPGIPKEAQRIIFEVFRQQDNSTHKHSGSGLGLAIVKELATLMDGQIELESESGQGSIFTVFLPVEPVKEPVTK
jgi:PAS domain S-box-containing protein